MSNRSALLSIYTFLENRVLNEEFRIIIEGIIDNEPERIVIKPLNILGYKYNVDNGYVDDNFPTSNSVIRHLTDVNIDSVKAQYLNDGIIAEDQLFPRKPRAYRNIKRDIKEQTYIPRSNFGKSKMNLNKSDLKYLCKI